MSSGQKACAEDEDSWYDFCRKHDISSSKWKVYSVESGHALALVKQFPTLSGAYLVKAVGLLSEIHNCVELSRRKKERYAEYLKLKEEFEKQS